jgi:ribosomal protein L11 methyltransferase
VPVVEVVVDPEQAELAADALWQGAPSAVAEEVQPDGRIRLVADVADLDAIPHGWEVVVVEVDPDVEDGWRRFAAPVRAGRFLVQPAWLPGEAAEPGETVIELDPGRVFGSGSHVSTRQVLELVDGIELDDAEVLDLGSGSGVLAIAALLRGARRAVALDIDPDAAAIAAANAVRNGVEAGLEASGASVTEVDGPFDLVLANIGERVLVDLAPAVLSRVRGGGALVLAGLLDDQADAVMRAYAPAVVEAVSSVDGWTALRLRA